MSDQKIGRSLRGWWNTLKRCWRRRVLRRPPPLCGSCGGSGMGTGLAYRIHSMDVVPGTPSVNLCDTCGGTGKQPLSEKET